MLGRWPTRSEMERTDDGSEEESRIANLMAIGMSRAQAVQAVARDAQRVASLAPMPIHRYSPTKCKMCGARAGAGADRYRYGLRIYRNGICQDCYPEYMGEED